MSKVAINGLGRIGRATLKVILDYPELELVAVNDIGSPENLIYLLTHDSVYGRYDRRVEFRDSEMIVDGEKRIRILGEKDPSKLPWKEYDLDVVFECSGVFTRKEDMQKHLEAGARHVILSAPEKENSIPTVLPGVNELNRGDKLISCASCTTNCIAPVIEIIDRRIGVKKAVMSTVHAYTASQGIVDGPSKKPERGRAAAINLVPTSTGAAKATTQVLPQVENRFEGVAVRSPVPAGSLADITILAKRETSVEEVNKIMEEEARTNRYEGVFAVSHETLVSTDIIGDPRASIADLSMTRVVDGDLVKIMSWYDNEWGYVNQLVKAGVDLAEPAEA